MWKRRPERLFCFFLFPQIYWLFDIRPLHSLASPMQTLYFPGQQFTLQIRIDWSRHLLLPAVLTRCVPLQCFSVQSCEAVYPYTRGLGLGYQGNPALIKRLLEGDWIRQTLLKGSAERFNPIIVSFFFFAHCQPNTNWCVCVCVCVHLLTWWVEMQYRVIYGLCLFCVGLHPKACILSYMRSIAKLSASNGMTNCRSGLYKLLKSVNVRLLLCKSVCMSSVYQIGLKNLRKRNQITRFVRVLLS